jgi:cell wall assembly regulator SMI1
MHTRRRCALSVLEQRAVQAVDTFKTLLARLAPYQAGASFPPPATGAAMTALQQHVGKELPPALVAVYEVFDGGPKVPGDRLAENLFYSYRFLSVGEVLTFSEGWNHIRQAEDKRYARDPIPSFPAGAVQDLYSSADWIPFADDGAGGNLAIDFAPGPRDVSGQIINFGAHDAAHFQLATSFELFLERVLRDYKQKKLHHFFGDSMMLVDRLLQQQSSRNH